MPIKPTYPGIYVEEIPSGVRTITGVSTSVGAFIDFFKKGPMDKAVQCFNMGDFEREFGGLDSRSEASYAIQQFYLNGGREAWVVRTADGPKKAKVTIKDGLDGGSGEALAIEAANEGIWGNNLGIKIDYKTSDPTTLFNIILSEYEGTGATKRLVRSEEFLNLSMGDGQRNARKVINNESKLISVVNIGTKRPLQNGTVSGDLSSFPQLSAAQPAVNVTIGNISKVRANFKAKPTNLEEARSLLEDAIRSCKPDVPAFAAAVVEMLKINNSKCLRILAGPSPDPSSIVTFEVIENADDTAKELKLDKDSAVANVQEYALGVSVNDKGTDGTPPNSGQLIGSMANKKGLYALEDVDLFNILCIPRTAALPETDAAAVIAVANTYCEKRRAFFIMDAPSNIIEMQKIKEWLGNHDTLRHKNSALYFPRVKIADPLDENRLRSFGPSGTIAGLYARIDSSRGVWKAPAGTDGTLVNVQDFDCKLTDDQNGALNPLAINCLRNLAVYGNVCWGARTLDGADIKASDWKYLSVRRLALYIEESLYRGTKWVIFEGNDEPLWAQIRLNVGAFMNDLFRQGAFQGKTPSEAYFVKCDKETTTQNDRNNGIVNMLVGFAPLKPAEFVVIQIQQMAGQIPT